MEMAPKQKRICDVGSVQRKSSGHWRATLKVDGKLETGPTRSEKSTAEADLVLARKTSNKSDMAACLQRLKHEAATAREHATETCAENANIIKDLKRQNEELKTQNVAKDKELAAIGKELIAKTEQIKQLQQNPEAAPQHRIDELESELRCERECREAMGEKYARLKRKFRSLHAADIDD